MKDTFVIVPTYNEDLSVLKDTLSGLLDHFDKVVLVNDGGGISLSHDLRGYPIHYLRHEINLGQGAALQTGMEYALALGALKIAFFDADGQHNAEDLVKMVRILNQESYDIILGSRFLNKNHTKRIPFFRRIVLKAATYINYFFTGLMLTDAHHGLKVLNHVPAQKLKFNQNRQLHATELLSYIRKYDWSYKEVPAAISYSSYSIEKGQKNRHIFRIFSDLIFSKFVK